MSSNRTRAGAPPADPAPATSDADTTTAAPAPTDADTTAAPTDADTTAAPTDADTTAAPATSGTDRVAELEAEVAELRAQLLAAGVSAGRRTPHVPSFGISEGVRQDVEMHGKATDPATGRVVTRADLEK